MSELNANLVSCSSLCDENYDINFSSTKCVGILEGVTQFQGQKENGVFKIQCRPIIPGQENAHIKRRDSSNFLEVWHKTLGHAHPERIRRLIRTNAVTGLNAVPSPSTSDCCPACMKGKQSKVSLKPDKSRATMKCAVVHADVCRPMSVSSFSEARYFVCFVDDYSGYITVIPITRKSDVRNNFICYHAWLERKFDCSIKRLHSDNGGEFVALAGYLKEKGIEQTMTPSYSPNLNGVAERANRTIVESARAMLAWQSWRRMFE